MENQGGLYVIVNCVGIGFVMKMYGSKGFYFLDIFQKVIVVNLVGMFNVICLVVEVMVKNELVIEDGECGVIINIVFVVVFDGQVGQVVYFVLKGGVVGMMLFIVWDFFIYGICVNVIVLGIFNIFLMNVVSDIVKLLLIEMIQFLKCLGNFFEYGQMVCQMVENGFFNGEVVCLDGFIWMLFR